MSSRQAEQGLQIGGHQARDADLLPAIAVVKTSSSIVQQAASRPYFTGLPSWPVAPHFTLASS
jgi:hypothetical protein